MSEKTPDAASGDSPAESHAQKLRPCPICGKPALFEVRPFCSKRCADVDLHRWLGGTYAIPVVEDDLGEGKDLDEES
jgi:endogenous inhibitor of DNA gyrase (YacG/DUF329 family)